MMLLMDVDGVLADFTGAVCLELSDILERKVTPKECFTWSFQKSFLLNSKQNRALFSRICRKNFCRDLALLPGAQKGVQRLIESNKVGGIRFVTSPWDSSNYWIKERTDWIYKHFNCTPFTVIHTHDKGSIIGDIIIDDKPANVLAGSRKLRILVPNAANKKFIDARVGNAITITKHWTKIIKAVGEL